MRRRWRRISNKIVVERERVGEKERERELLCMFNSTRDLI